ncbi:MAG: hypothetical protein NC340_06590 [Ruminococcus flavefaciens]|nr:hypothetical protein [Ruminococcus flavefaciens]MCM1229704.1 hypothetical protein [Ruminococcus flavefaciens]
MVYSSLLFIYGFFPISLAIYYFTPKKLKDISLFVLSMIFCGLFSLKFLFFMLIYTAVNYTSARFTYNLKWKESKYGKFSSIPFTAGIIFDIVSLLAFRTEFFSWIQKPFSFPDGFFPIGISLFTLSATGYLIDIYKGRIRAEINFIRFGLFIMMFPRLLLGPVVSYDNFIKILRKRRIRLSELGNGMELFVKGLAKKVIVADTLFMLYSAIRSIDIKNLPVVTAWLGVIAYMLCLYFTLSGISDMGCGISYCFGFRFPQSFNYPVFSSRIRYFSAKWHIQIVHWFRKYAVQPFRSVINAKYINGFISVSVWTLLGLWYGFSAGSTLWGLLMGLAVIIEGRIKNIKMLKSTGIIYTFLATTILMTFLSCGSIGDSFRYIWAMLGGNRIFADSLTSYLVKSYIIILLTAMYMATDLFRNTVNRINRTRFRIVVSVLSPVILVILFAVCTSLISYTGSSENILIQL